MTRTVRKPEGYIEGVTCPACEDNMLKAEEAHNSYSRFAEHYVCSACGVREAFGGFFWRVNALRRGIAMNAAGQAEHAKATRGGGAECN